MVSHDLTPDYVCRVEFPLEKKQNCIKNSHYLDYSSNVFLIHDASKISVHPDYVPESDENRVYLFIGVDNKCPSIPVS